MDRFLIAENPMSNHGQTAVIHTVNPVAIIECIEGHQECNSPYRHYSFTNVDGLTENWTLRVHLMTTEFDSEQHHIIVTKLLDRAWHWYKSYMQWEDEQINEK